MYKLCINKIKIESYFVINNKMDIKKQNSPKLVLDGDELHRNESYIVCADCGSVSIVYNINIQSSGGFSTCVDISGTSDYISSYNYCYCPKCRSRIRVTDNKDKQLIYIPN